MNTKVSFFFLSLFLLNATNLVAGNIIIVDSLSKIDFCRQFSTDLKISSNAEFGEGGVFRIGYNDLFNRFSDAKDRFYKLDISEAEKGFEEIIKIISDAVVSGGDAEDIFDIFGRSLLYKMLIMLTQNRNQEAMELFRNYFTIISNFPIDNKKFHPFLISFLVENGPTVQNSIKYDTESHLSLRKAFQPKGKILFDSSTKIPELIADTRHILIFTLEDNTFRAIVRNFLEDKDPYFLIQDSKKEVVYLALNEEALNKIALMKAGMDIIYCNDSENGLIRSDGRRLSREEAFGRNMQVETIDNSKLTGDSWYKQWWVYVGGGTLVAAIVTSIIILNTQDSSKGDFHDHIQLR